MRWKGLPWVSSWPRMSSGPKISGRGRTAKFGVEFVGRFGAEVVGSFGAAVVVTAAGDVVMWWWGSVFEVHSHSEIWPCLSVTRRERHLVWLVEQRHDTAV